MDAKEEIEVALNKAIFATCVREVIKRYMAEEENPTIDAAPMLAERAMEMFKGGR